MSVTIDGPVAPAAPAPRPARASHGWSPRVRVVAWMIALAWLVLVAAVSVTGEQRSTLADLEAAIAAGEVDRVEVAGQVMDRGTIGYLPVDVRWREGLTSHWAPVGQASDRRQERHSTSPGQDVVIGSITDRLHSLDRDLVVVRSPQHYRSGPAIEWGSWRAEGWAAGAYLVLLLATIALANLRTPPWRATRTAWTWLMLLAPPVGIAGFLLLGGPTGLFPPLDPRRIYLRGGWAFLLALVLAGSAPS